MRFSCVCFALLGNWFALAVKLLNTTGSVLSKPHQWHCGKDDECQTEFVSKYGILTAMDVHPLHDKQHDTTHFHEDDYKSLRNTSHGDMELLRKMSQSAETDVINAKYYIESINEASHRTVYVITTVMNAFVEHVFPHVKNPFVLVTGDALTVAPDGIFKSKSEFIDFIGDERVLFWFAQNGNSKHEKFAIIPNGLDYHNLWRDVSKDKRKKPVDQEKELKKAIEQAPDLAKRNQSIAVGPFSMTNGKRRLTKFAFENVPEGAKLVPDSFFGHLSREAFWKRIADHVFVASPRGAGWDCHRTWESLALGTMPIVDSTGMDSFWALHKLPVLVVPKWNKVLQYLNSNFKEKYESVLKLRVDLNNTAPKALKLNYWLELIDAARKGKGSVSNYMRRVR